MSQIYKVSLRTGACVSRDRDRIEPGDADADKYFSSRRSQYSKLDDCIHDID